MKIRIGFVSNSSSQSFVMIGIETNQICNLKEKLAKRFGFELPEWVGNLDDVSINEIIENEKYSCADEGKYFGYRVAVIDDDYMETFSLSFEDIEECANELREFLGEDIEIRLIGGTEVC